MQKSSKGLYFLKLLLTVVVFIIFSGVSGITSPLNIDNRFPALLMFLTPSPDSPDIPDYRVIHLSASIDYTSVFVFEDSSEWEVLMDFEMTTVSLFFELTPFERLSVSAKALFVDMGNGFLDGFLEEYHSAGGFPDYGRSERPHNEFQSYIMERDGEYWFQAENEGFKPVDSVVSIKFLLAKEPALLSDSGYSFSSAVKYSLKVPVGDVGQGLSSEGYDHGFFLLAQFSKERFTFNINPGFIVLEKPETSGADVSIESMATLFTGVSYYLNEKWDLNAQLNCFTSPFDIGIKYFDDPGVEIAFGCNYKYTKDLTIEFAFSEDLSGSVPDFTVHSGIVYRF